MPLPKKGLLGLETAWTGKLLLHYDLKKCNWVQWNPDITQHQGTVKIFTLTGLKIVACYSGVILKVLVISGFHCVKTESFGNRLAATSVGQPSGEENVSTCVYMFIALKVNTTHCSHGKPTHMFTSRRYSTSSKVDSACASFLYHLYIIFYIISLHVKNNKPSLLFFDWITRIGTLPLNCQFSNLPIFLIGHLSGKRHFNAAGFLPGTLDPDCNFNKSTQRNDHLVY